RYSANSVSIAPAPTIVDPYVTSVYPTQFLQPPHKRRVACSGIRIISHARQHADEPHPVWLLRPRGERPDRRSANKRDELAPPHSITSSARLSSDEGTVRPNIRAVCALMTNSNLAALTIGSSAGLAPLRMRPT